MGTERCNLYGEAKAQEHSELALLDAVFVANFIFVVSSLLALTYNRIVWSFIARSERGVFFLGADVAKVVHNYIGN